ncbi:MAG: hypothetical protein Q8L78_07100 [Coxiellaceae bacterium]|nr:hypothetical protein [Coxiellaceae bacterium]
MKDASQNDDQKKYHFLFMLSAEKALIENDKNHCHLILEGVDEKLLFMTARPGRTRAFMSAATFLNNWKENPNVFLAHPPRVALIDSAMPTDGDGIAKAAEIALKNPVLLQNGHWQFDLKFLENTLEGIHPDAILMIDWPAALPCPPAIKIQVPSLILE